jgi:hypothetical protein
MEREQRIKANNTEGPQENQRDIQSNKVTSHEKIRPEGAEIIAHMN